jgi:hypothetical protein
MRRFFCLYFVATTLSLPQACIAAYGQAPGNLPVEQASKFNLVCARIARRHSPPLGAPRMAPTARRAR